MHRGLDTSGRAVNTDDPGDAKPTWVPQNLQSEASLAAVACPSVTLCVVTGHHTGPPYGAFVLAATDPAAPKPVWTTTPLPFGGGAGVGPVPSLLTCASASLCMVVQGTAALISNDPAGASPAWKEHTIIDLPPVGTPGVPSVPVARGTPAGTPTVSSVPIVRARTVSFAFSCSVTVGSFDSYAHECAGRATVTTTERLARNGRTIIGLGQRPRSRRHRVVVIGRADFLGRGGAAPQTIIIKLDSVGTRLLARFKRVPATVTVVATVRGQEDLSLMAPIGAFHVTFARRSATRIGSRNVDR